MSSEMSASGGGNSGGGNSEGRTVAMVANDEFMVKMKPCIDVKVGRQYYNMSSNPRGFCLIFNVFEFPNTEYDIRKGSKAEANNLSEVFEELHFNPIVFDNPSQKEIELMVDEYSQKPELEEHDAIIIIVLSHGKRDGFIASDGLYIAFKDIVDKLNNKNCSKLIDKPKLFFFSCCRGDTKDPGVAYTIQALDDMHLNAVTDTIVVKTPEADSTKSLTRLVPMVSDVMICYSTVDGYVSWRCEETGTWLGSALYRTLLKRSHDTDLLQMLTDISSTVDERVANAGSPAKQVIEIILRGFKKTLYFNPGHLIKTSTTDMVLTTDV